MKKIFAACLLFAAVWASSSVAPLMAQDASGKLVTATEAAKLLPDAVFFRGQSASTQTRNSGGVHYGDGMYVLATLVDNSGYSTAVKEKYQAYFITETALKIEGETLPAGIYGVGFLANNKFVVMDVGAHDVLSVSSMHDEKMARPRPLQVLSGDGESRYKLCFGRDCVSFERK